MIRMIKKRHVWRLCFVALIGVASLVMLIIIDERLAFRSPVAKATIHLESLVPPKNTISVHNAVPTDVAGSPEVVLQPSQVPVTPVRSKAPTIRAVVSPPVTPVRSKAPTIRTVVSPLHEAVTPRLFYDSRFPEDDRVVSQLRYKPNGYSDDTARTQTILIWNGIRSKHWWFHDAGSSVFNRDHCSVKACTVTGDRSRAHSVDAILFDELDNRDVLPKHKRPKNQVWIFFTKEAPSPRRSTHLQGLEHLINWTSTYRRDSTILVPYQKFFPYTIPRKVIKRNYAIGRTKKVAWFASNCRTQNKRLAYAKELQKHIDVDIIGRCGNMTCGRNQSISCNRMLTEQYKFYLAFENTNCRDYITEKLWVNALQQNVIPIVMGAPPDDYRKQAPLHSFIHVDDFKSPKELAEYLNLLDKRDDLYNLYFEWKGSGEFSHVQNHFWWCRLCAMLHAPRSHHVVPNLHAWWRGKGVCIDADSWTKHGYVPRTPLGRRHNSTNPVI